MSSRKNTTLMISTLVASNSLLTAVFTWSWLVACLILLFATCPAAANAQQHQQPPLDPETTIVMDGCTMVQGHEEGTKVTIVVAAAENRSVTATRLHFINCAIPDDMDISIAVPVVAESEHAVHIELVNTTMQGGSLEIVPHEDGRRHQQPLHQASLQRVHVTVNHATLRCAGDVLVVNSTTTSSTNADVEDITIQLQNVVLTSSRGSVASVVTDGEKNSAVSRCRIHIGGNSTMEAMHLVGSVQTSKLTNSTLSVVQPHCAGSIAPIRLVAGGETVSGAVGVLSILPPMTNEGTFLHLEDVEILVEHNNLAAWYTEEPSFLSMHLAATVGTGRAVVAGVALRHPANVQLTMSGAFTIEIAALAREVLTRNVDAQSATRRTMHRLQEEQPAVPPPSCLDSIHMSIIATALGESSAASVGGFALLAYDNGATTTATVSIYNCTLRLHTSARIDARTMFLSATVHNPYSATALLGVAVNSISRSSGSMMTIDHGSSVTIGSSTAASNGNITMLAPSSSGYRLATALLGIAVNSISDITSTSTVTINRGSSLTIGSRIAASTSNVTMLAPSSGGHLATALLGVAVNSISSSSSGTSMMTVSFNSNLTIGISTAGSVRNNVTMLAPSSSAYLATALLGVTVNCISSSNSSTSVMTIDHGSSVTIGSSTAASSNSSVTMTAPSCNGYRLATALLGVALNSFASSTSTSTVIINGNSSLTIGSSTAGSSNGSNVTMLAPSGSSHTLATALLGVAVNSHPGPSMVTIGHGCVVRIDALLTGEGTQAIASVVHSTAAVAVAGIIVRGGTGSIFEVTGPSPSFSSSSPTVDVWVGLQSGSQLAVGAKSAMNGVVLGVVAPTFNGLSSQNTKLSLCIDNVTEPPSAIGGGGVALGTNRGGGVAATTTVGWLAEPTSNAGTPPLHVTPSNHSLLCSIKAAALHATLLNMTDLLDNLGDLPDPEPEPFVTPSRSATSSRSGPTPTVSGSMPLAASPRSSATLSASQTDDQAFLTNEPSPNSTIPSPPKRRTVQITTSVLLPNNEVAATVVLSTAGASGAVASTLGSGGAGVVVTAGSSVRMMECGLAEDDPRPATFELPIQFPVGGGTMRYFAGAALAHTLLQCVMLAFPVLLRRSGAANKPHIVQLLSLVFCGVHPFFTPAVLGACSTVLFNDDDMLSVAVAGMSALVVAAIHSVVTLAVHRGPVNGLGTRRASGDYGFNRRAKLKFVVSGRSSTTSTTSSSSSSSSSTSSDEECTDRSTTATSEDSLPSNTAFLFSAEATKDVLLTLFDGCRHYEKVAHRHYSSIETTLYSVIAIISGARPQQNCAAAAFSIGLLAALQLVYIVFVRPLRTRLDMLFSVLNGAVLVVLSLAVAISLQRRSESDDSAEVWALKTVEVCLWLISSLGFMQLGVQGYWAYHVHHRRRHQRGEDDISSDSGSSQDDEEEDETAEPLLVPVEMREKKNPDPHEEEEEHVGGAFDNPLLLHRSSHSN